MINFIIPDNQQTIDSVLTYNCEKSISVIQTEYRNIFTQITRQFSTNNGNIVTNGVLTNVDVASFTNSQKSLFTDWTDVISEYFEKSKLFFICEKPFILQSEAISKLEKIVSQPFVGYVYSDYVLKGNIVFCDERLSNPIYCLIKKDILLHYKIPTMSKLNKINQHINIHIPEPLIELI